jgi:hypothetical protein
MAIPQGYCHIGTDSAGVMDQREAEQMPGIEVRTGMVNAKCDGVGATDAERLSPKHESGGKIL